MKILYHHRTQLSDAQGIHIGEMAEAFRALGHEVAMVSPVNGKTEEKEKTLRTIFGLLAKSVPLWIYELMGIGYNIYGYWFLRECILRENPDFIYERYSLNTFCGIWASANFGIPLVLEVNAPLFLEQSNLKKLFFSKFAKFSERWICSNSTWTIAVSEELKNILISEGVPERKVVVMTNGIDPKEFHLKVSGERIRSQYALHGKIVVGFVGWFRLWHGLEMLLEVFREGGMAEKDVKVLLVGDGPAYPQLQQFVQIHQMSNDVLFSGVAERHQVPEYIAAMDIAIQPSVTEYACPMKIIEYMGMGKCIVAPNQPNVRELLESDISGKFFIPKDKQSLQSALWDVINDSIKRDKMGIKAYEALHMREFFWSKNAQKVISFFNGNMRSDVRHIDKG